MVRDACMQELDHAKLQSKTYTLSPWATSLVQIVVHCGTLEVIVSGSTKSAITSKIRGRLNHEEMLHVILTIKPSSKVNIFHKISECKCTQAPKKSLFSIRCRYVVVAMWKYGLCRRKLAYFWRFWHRYLHSNLWLLFIVQFSLPLFYIEQRCKWPLHLSLTKHELLRVQLCLFCFNQFFLCSLLSVLFVFLLNLLYTSYSYWGLILIYFSI